MEFTSRTRQILMILLESGKPIPEQQIADSIGVSKRTVQREAEYLGSDLLTYHLELKRKKSAGVYIEGDSVDLLKLKEDLKQSAGTEITDKNLRRKYLTAELLKERIPKKLFYFSEKFGVSEATISKDLDAVEEWMEQSHIHLIRKPGYGVILEHNEKNYRKALQRFVNENVGDEDIRALVKNHGQAMTDVIDSYGNRNIYELLNSDVLGRVSRTFQAMDEPRLKLMTDESYIGLMLHITIAIDRIQKGEVLNENNSRDLTYEPDEDYLLAREMIHRLSEEFDLTIPESETAYILLHIRGAKVNYSGQQQGEAMGADEILNLIDRMLGVFDNETAYELKCDEEFVHGLMMHLEPALIRIRNDMNIYNPLLDEIRKEYPDIYVLCKEAAKIMQQQTGCEVPDSEVGFLTMHFGAAIEKIRECRIITRNVEIGVICASGFGVARLMMTKLENNLSRNVRIRTYGRDEVTPYIKGRTDFFVTSFDFFDEGMDYLKVSPLITRNELLMIQAKADEYSHIPKKQEDTDFTRQLETINELSVKIKSLIRNYHNYIFPSGCTLEELLGRAAVLVTENQACAALLKADLLAREKVMTQVFPEMGFALFHTRTKAVKKVAFYTISPEEQTIFQDGSLGGIRSAVLMLMPLGAKEEQEQDKEMLGQISSAFVEDETFLQTIFTADEADIREKLQTVLKTFFNDYISKFSE